MDFLLSHPELHEAFRTGDRETLGVVYDELEPELIEIFTGGFLIESTGMRVPPLTNPDDVADLVHDTMALVLAEDVRKRWDGKSPFNKYAWATARNRRITHYRKTHREKPSSDRESEAEIAERLGISRTRVHQLKERMLKDLYKLMKRAGVHASADRLTPGPGAAAHG